MESYKAKARALLEAKAEAAAQRIIDIAESPTDQRNMQAALAILNRIGLHEKSGLEVGGDGGSPVVFEVVTGVPRGNADEVEG